MRDALEPLSWDSDFFDISIARVDLNGLDSEALEAVKIEARKRGFRCLYGNLDPEPPESSVEPQRAGFRLMEVGLTLRRTTVEAVRPRHATVRARRGREGDLPHLSDVIETLVPWGRFAVDPRFGPEASRQLYEAWIDRALRAPDDERMLAIVEDESGIIGCSTHVMFPEPRMDLISVTKPGSGASAALMVEFAAWADSPVLAAGPVAARNIAILRYFERFDFRSAHARYSYHCWLDETTGSAS